MLNTKFGHCSSGWGSGVPQCFTGSGHSLGDTWIEGGQETEGFAAMQTDERCFVSLRFDLAQFVVDNITDCALLQKRPIKMPIVVLDKALHKHFGELLLTVTC